MAWGLPHYKSSMAIRNSRLVALSSGNYVLLPKISSHHPNIKHPKIAWSSFFSLEIAYWFHGFMVSFWGCFFSSTVMGKGHAMSCQTQKKTNPNRIVTGSSLEQGTGLFAAPSLHPIWSSVMGTCRQHQIPMDDSHSDSPAETNRKPLF